MITIEVIKMNERIQENVLDFDYLPAPERVTFNSEEELVEMVMAGLRSVQEGRAEDGDIVMERLAKKYGFSV